MKHHISTVHEDEKVLKPRGPTDKCPICEKLFQQKYLIHHTSSVQEGKKIYDCSICNLRFTYQNNLKKHTKIKHEIQ